MTFPFLLSKFTVKMENKLSPKAVKSCDSFGECKSCALAVLNACQSKRDCSNCAAKSDSTEEEITKKVFPKPSCYSFTDCRTCETVTSLKVASNCDSIEECKECNSKRMANPKIVECDSLTECVNCASLKKEARFQHMLEHFTKTLEAKK